MTEQNEMITEEIEEGNADDIFGMIGMSAEDLKTDKPAEKPKKEKKPAEKAEKRPAEAKPAKRYKYPFEVYFAGRVHDLTGFFEDGKEYTEKQISEVMLAQHFYEFSGQVSYDFMEDTNTLVAMFHQHKKG